MNQDGIRERSHLVCIEGLAGSGKSALVSNLTHAFSSENVLCQSFKLAGLGNSRRVGLLQKIRTFRQSAYISGMETPKQREDRLQGRIYQIALAAQVRELKDLVMSNRVPLYLLDRSPFMNSVHLRAVAQITQEDNDSEHLSCIEDIFKRELSIISTLGIKHIVLLDVEPELAFARMITRYYGNNDREINSAISGLKTTSERRRQIYQRVC